MNAIITNNTIQHTKDTLWKTIIHSPFLQPTRSKCIYSTVFEVSAVGRGNLAISKLLALKNFGPFLQSTYYWMSRSTFLGGGEWSHLPPHHFPSHA